MPFESKEAYERWKAAREAQAQSPGYRSPATQPAPRPSNASNAKVWILGIGVVGGLAVIAGVVAFSRPKREKLPAFATTFPDSLIRKPQAIDTAPRADLGKMVDSTLVQGSIREIPGNGLGEQKLYVNMAFKNLTSRDIAEVQGEVQILGTGGSILGTYPLTLTQRIGPGETLPWHGSRTIKLTYFRNETAMMQTPGLNMYFLWRVTGVRFADGSIFKS